MQLLFDAENPRLVPIIPFMPHYLSSAGGDITVERKLPDDSWVAVDGSPITANEEVVITTKSVGDKIRITASVPGVVVQMGRVRR